MARTLAFFLAAGLAALAPKASGAEETLAAAHNQPITIRILDGKHGQPVAHIHLLLLAGYDLHDIRHQLWHDEALTDDHGAARLPRQLADLPFLQVWAAKKSLCQAYPRSEYFSVDRMRQTGISAPNRCGIATVEDAPGVFTVFVKARVAKTRISARPAAAPATTTAPAVSAPAPAPAPARDELYRSPLHAACFVLLPLSGLLR